MDMGFQNLEPSSADFQGHKHGARLGAEQLGHEWVPIWDAGATGDCFFNDTTGPAPNLPRPPFLASTHNFFDLFSETYGHINVAILVVAYFL